MTQPEHAAGQGDKDLPSFAVVGIGASAGGLAALKAFFHEVPERCGLAFVIVVHLAAEQESHLADLLQPHVAMPVLQVSEDMPLEPDHVYVIPPGCNLNAVDTHLRLSSLEELRRDRAPIDHFFRTLAKTHDGVSIGVILSGTGSDGTLGMKEIKVVGGLTVAQDPVEAEYDGMPQSAISTGLVDLILPVADIPGAIERYVHTKPHIEVPEDGQKLEGDQRQLLHKLFSQVRGRTGRDFSHYKRSTIMRRIQRRMQLHQIERLEDYLAFLRFQPEETRALADEFLVTVTNFFRDHEVFAMLDEHVIPRLFEDKEPDDTIRLWSVGCATGEEAYSLAMLLSEEASRRDNPPQLQVFASDLHEGSLKVAREGLYPGNIDSDVAPERLRRFFTKQSGGYRMRQEVRELVVFAPHNLLSDPPFSKLDMISCRNLLIYLQRDVQREVIELFHYALRGEGVLLLGTSETVGRTDLFRVEDKKHCIYRKRNVPSREPRLPVFTTGPRRQITAQHSYPAPADAPASYALLHTQMVERHAPPSVLINQDHDVVHLSEGAGRYMRVPGGEPTSSVFKLLREELRIELRAALHTTEKEGRPIRTEPMMVEIEGERRCVAVQVWPNEEPQHEGLCLLVFEEKPEPLETEASDRDEGSEDLRSELDLTKQRLQNLIEKYETNQEEMKAANEELQSANEELRSTMEELETSKEELQSMNEELTTLNQENRHKVEELGQLSGDLQNLMAATDIATLFLDRDLRILRFTPQVGELFNVRASDRGRPLTDLTHRLGYDNFATDARRVLDRLSPIENEVQDHLGRWYLTRVLPYRSTHDRIGGVVITLVEITARKQAEEALRRTAEADAFRLTLSDAIRPLADPLEIQATAAHLVGERLGVNRVFYAELGDDGERGQVRTAYHEDVANITGEYGFGDHGAALMQELRAGRTVVVANVDEDSRLDSSARERARELAVAAFVAVPVVKDGSPVGVFVIQQREPRSWDPDEVALVEETVERMWSAAERVQAAAALRESEERYRTLFESIDEGFCIIEVLYDAADEPFDYRFLETNPGFENQTGIRDAVGRTMRELAPEHEHSWYEVYGRVATTGTSVRFQSPAAALGRFFDVYAFRVGAPEDRRVAALFTDISKRKELEDELREVANKLAESNRRKDEFLATLAHELRNPLAPIANAMTLLRHPDNQVPVHELYAVIERQLNHMVRIVEDLLDLSRITRGVVELRPEPVELAGVIRNAVETSRPVVEEGQRQLFVDLGTEPMIVHADPTRLVQIVSNLLNNAAKYSDDEARIWLKLSREGEHARISVRDEGIGIPEHMLGRVFDMFTQIDRSRASGLGIGLTLVRSLVHRHGGSVEVYSEGPGRGAEFVVYLPLVSEPSEVQGEVQGEAQGAAREPQSLPPAQERPALASVPASLRVLVVDDNVDAADSLGGVLRALGASVDVAYEGQRALELFDEQPYAVAFLDLGMPTMDGFELAAALRERPAGREALLVALTGWNQAKDRQRVREASFDHHLVKPAATEDLVEVLTKAPN